LGARPFNVRYYRGIDIAIEQFFHIPFYLSSFLFYFYKIDSQFDKWRESKEIRSEYSIGISLVDDTVQI